MGGLIVPSGGSACKNWFSSASHGYNDMISDFGDITIVDDPEWQQYNDVAEVVKMTPGGEGNCISVAYSATAGVWAAGLASGNKPRLNAVKMAICLALAAASPNLPTLCANYPEFAALLQQAGVTAGGMLVSVFDSKTYRSALCLS